MGSREGGESGNPTGRLECAARHAFELVLECTGQSSITELVHELLYEHTTSTGLVHEPFFKSAKQSPNARPIHEPIIPKPSDPKSISATIRTFKQRGCTGWTERTRYSAWPASPTWRTNTRLLRESYGRRAKITRGSKKKAAIATRDGWKRRGGGGE